MIKFRTFSKVCYCETIFYEQSTKLYKALHQIIKAAAGCRFISREKVIFSERTNFSLVSQNSFI